MPKIKISAKFSDSFRAGMVVPRLKVSLEELKSARVGQPEHDVYVPVFCEKEDRAMVEKVLNAYAPEELKIEDA